MAHLAVSTETFQKEVLESELPVLVDFWAVWCGPCQMVNPILDQLAQDYQGKLKIVKLNVDENQETAAKYDVMSIPAFIIFHKGEKLGSFVGALPKEMFIEQVDQLLAKIPKANG